jgi:hypothetical protein
VPPKNLIAAWLRYGGRHFCSLDRFIFPGAHQPLPIYRRIRYSRHGWHPSGALGAWLIARRGAVFQIADYFPVDAKLALRSNCSVLNRFNAHPSPPVPTNTRTRHEIVLRLGFETLPPRLLVLPFRRISRAAILCTNDSR